MYTIISGNTIGCVKTVKECGSMYTIDDEQFKACVDTPDKCNIYWYVAYNWTGTKLCI